MNEDDSVSPDYPNCWSVCPCECAVLAWSNVLDGSKQLYVFSKAHMPWMYRLPICFVPISSIFIFIFTFSFGEIELYFTVIWNICWINSQHSENNDIVISHRSLSHSSGLRHIFAHMTKLFGLFITPYWKLLCCFWTILCVAASKLAHDVLARGERITSSQPEDMIKGMSGFSNVLCPQKIHLDDRNFCLKSFHSHQLFRWCLQDQQQPATQRSGPQCPGNHQIVSLPAVFPSHVWWSSNRLHNFFCSYLFDAIAVQKRQRRPKTPTSPRSERIKLSNIVCEFICTHKEEQNNKQSTFCLCADQKENSNNTTIDIDCHSTFFCNCTFAGCAADNSFAFSLQLQLDPSSLCWFSLYLWALESTASSIIESDNTNCKSVCPFLQYHFIPWKNHFLFDDKHWNGWFRRLHTKGEILFFRFWGVNFLHKWPSLCLGRMWSFVFFCCINTCLGVHKHSIPFLNAHEKGHHLAEQIPHHLPI